MHFDIEPAILYFGTPVVLISTLNEDGSVNLAPMSSIWWLGWTAVIGLDATSKTTENILRTGECVLNLPAADVVDQVNKLAKTTGQQSVPLHKKAMGYRFEKHKLEIGGFNTLPSVKVSAPRVKECTIQLEAKLVKTIPIGDKDDKMAIPTAAIELQVIKVHVEETVLVDKQKAYVDPDKWHPLIMSFRKFYTTSDYIHPSKLAIGDEKQYAPWKNKTLKRKLIQWLVGFNTRKYRKRINGENKDV